MATRSLGTLTVDLIAKTGGFERGMDAAQRRTSRASRQIQSDTERMQRSVNNVILAVGAAAAAAGTAIAAIASQTSQMMDETRKLAQATGLTVEAFSELRYVADQNALSQDQLVGALGRLSKGMDDARRGTGEAKRAFDALGVSVTDASGNLKSADEILLDLTEQFSQLEDSTQKSALAAQIFGRSIGPRMVPLLNNGRDGIKQLVDEAHRFGIVIDTEAAKAAERFNDNLTRLNAVKQGLAISLTTALLPAMEKFSETLVSVSSAVASNADLVEKALTALGATATAVSAIFAGRFVASLGAKVLAFGKASAASIAYQFNLARLAATVAGTSASVSAAVGAMAGATRGLQIALGLLGGPIGAISLAVAGAAYGWHRYTRSQREARQATIDMSASLEDQIEKFRDLTRAQQESSINAYEEELAEARRQMTQAFDDLHRFIGPRFRFGDAFQEFRQGIEDAKRGAADLHDVVSRFAQEANIPPAAARELMNLASQADGARGKVSDLAVAIVRLSDTMVEHAGAASGVTDGLVAYEELLDSWQAKYATRSERLASELNKIREEFAAIGKEAPEWLLDRARRSFAGAGGGGGTSESEASRLIKQIQDRVMALRQEAGVTEQLTESQRMLNAFERQLQTTRDKSIRQNEEAIRALLAQLAAQEKINRQAELENAIRQDHLESLEAQSEAAYQQAFELERQIQIMDRSESSVVRLDIAESRLALSRAESARAAAVEAGASEELIEFHDKEIERINRLISARELLLGRTQEMEALQEYKRLADEAQSYNEQIGQSLTDALLRGFENGANAAENFRRTLKNMFQTMVLRPIIQPVVQQAAGAITGALGLGGQGAMPGSGVPPGLNNIFSGLGQAITGASVGASGLSLGVANLAGRLGGDALGTLISMNAGWSGVGGAVSGFAGAAGAAMSAIGSALPWIGAGITAYSLLKDAFSGETRYGAGYGIGHEGIAIRSGGPSGGDPDEAATRQAIEQTWTSLHNLVGRLGGSLAGFTMGAGWELSPEKGRSFVWTDIVAPGEFVSHTEGIGRRDLPGVKDGNVVAQEFAVELQRTLIRGLQLADVDEHWREWIDQFDVSELDEAGVQSVVSMIDALVALQQSALDMGMANLANATAQAQANIIDLSGGIENFSSNLNAYYQAYFDEAERTANLQATLTRVVGELGYELPRTHAGFRDLVESLDLSTESGQQAYATLIGISGAFDQLARSLDSVGGTLDGLNAAFDEQLSHVRNLSSEVARLAGMRATAGGLLDRLNRNTTFAGQREAELWAAMQTASYEQQIDLASELSDIVLQRYSNEISAAERLQDLGRSLRDYLDSLMTSDLAPVDLATKVSRAEAQLQEAVARARAGDEDALQQVQGLTQNALELWRRYGASGDAYADAYYRITGMVGDLAGQVMTEGDRQLVVSQETLDQIDRLRAVAEDAYQLVDADYRSALQALGVETEALAELGVQTGRLGEIADLLRGLPIDIAASLNPLIGGAIGDAVSGLYAGTGITPDQSAMDYWGSQLADQPGGVVAEDFYRTLVSDWYRDNLGWAGDAQGIQYWADQVKMLGVQEAYEHFLRTAGIHGSHLNGLDMVPFDGYRAELHRSEAVLSASDAREWRASRGDIASGSNVMALLERIARSVEEADRNNVSGHGASIQASERSSERLAEAISQSNWEDRIR